jgi:uncharacterized protein
MMSMSFRSAVLAVLLLGSTSALYAQTAQKPAPAPAPQAAQPAPSASHLQAARELVVASGLQRAFANVIPDIMLQLYRNFSVTRPEIAKDLKATLDAQQNEFIGWGQEIVEVAARVYVAVMSEQECKDSLAFFNSAVGKKYVEVQPTIFANVGPVVEQWSTSISARMLERVRVEMKKKGHEM